MIDKRIAILTAIGIASLGLISAIVLFDSGYFIFPKQESNLHCASFNHISRIINVTGRCTLPDVYTAISDENILRKEPSAGAWFLNSSILISKGATLFLASNEVNWMKISSDGRSTMGRESNEFVPYYIMNFGKLDIDGVKITSWNPKINSYTSQMPNGTVPRPFITIGNGSDPVRIVNSELAYLGYNSSRKQGISFYGGDFSTLRGNRIHDMWYGFFSTNVGNITIEGNSVLNNYKYGIDPHLRSHDMTIKKNFIYNSRIGLICSLDCSNMLLEKNRIEKNNQIGLMLSRNATNSTLRYNNISSSDIGLSVSNSNSNNVYYNIVSQANEGVSVKNNSTNNILSNNTVIGPKECGILVSTGSKNNFIYSNYIHNYNKSGICLSNGAQNNSFSSNEIDGIGQFGIDVKDEGIANTFSENAIHLANNGIRVFNNNATIFKNNKIDNTYNHQYIVSGNSSLNLEDTSFLGDTVRSAGNDNNTLKIWNSGTIYVTTKGKDTNQTSTMKYNTDKIPFSASIYSMTLKLNSVKK